MFIVIPQFLVTGFAALVFAFVDSKKPALPGHHSPVAPHPGPATNLTRGLSTNITDSIINVSGHMLRRTEVEKVSHPDSVVYIFRYVLFVIQKARLMKFLGFQCWGHCCVLCFRSLL